MFVSTVMLRFGVRLPLVYLIVCFFRSAHPRRVRYSASTSTPIPYLFQSAHLHEVRCKLTEADFQNTLFQSAHPRRVRYWHSTNMTLWVMFQSAHMYKVRSRYNIHIFGINEFQSAHLREVRSLRIPAISPISCFNPRTCGRCDPVIFDNSSKRSCFNPRTCGRCDGNTQ